MWSQAPGREWVTTLSMHALVLLLVYLVYLILAPFLVPLGWAAVLVIFCYPWHARLAARWSRSAAAAVSTLLLIAVLILPALAVGVAFIREAAGALDAAQRALAAQPDSPGRLLEAMQGLIPEGIVLDVKALAGRAVESAGAWLAGRVGTVLGGTAVFFFDLGVTIFAAFFLFRDADGVMRRLRNALPIDEALREQLLAQIRTVITAAVTASFVVATVQGTLGGLAFWLVGISGPVFWGVLMALCCLIPLGAWVVWLPTAVWLIGTGSPGRGLLLMGLGVGIVSGVDNILRPVLISGQTRLNGLLMFMSLLGGVAAFGLLGLMLGPVVIATALVLLEAYSRAVESARAAEPPLPT